MPTRRFLILAFVLTAAVAVPARAASCTTGNPCTGSSATGSDSTDRTNFNADNSDLTFTNITFDSATGTYSLPGGLNDGNASGMDGVSFIGCFSTQTPCISNSTGLLVGDIGTWGGGANPAVQINSGTIGGPNWETFTITLPANTFAFGMDVIDQNNYLPGVAFTLNVGNNPSNSTAPAVTLPGSVFFGFRSVTAITAVSIYATSSNQQLALDNFEVGAAGDMAPVAEVKTLLLVGSGLLTLLYVRRRKGLSLRAA